jgi:AcrR family transcriptional regulator
MNTPTIDGRSKRAAETRESRRTQILDTALRLFSEAGYHQTSISDIVRAAGIARGTLYLYFDSKQEIFHQLLENLLLHLRTNIVGVDTSKDALPIPKQLEHTVKRILETALANRALTQIIFREAIGIDEEMDKRLETFYANLHSFIDESLQAGQELKLVRTMDTYVAARCVLGSIRGVIEHALFDEVAAVNPDALAKAVLEFNLRGLLIQSDL